MYVHTHMSVHLVVGAVLLLALAALQQVGGGATSFGHLVFPDGLLGENAPQLLQLVTRHFLRRNRDVKRWSIVKFCSDERSSLMV